MVAHTHNEAGTTGKRVTRKRKTSEEDISLGTQKWSRPRITTSQSGGDHVEEGMLDAEEDRIDDPVLMSDCSLGVPDQDEENPRARMEMITEDQPLVRTPLRLNEIEGKEFSNRRVLSWFRNCHGPEAGHAK